MQSVCPDARVDYCMQCTHNHISASHNHRCAVRCADAVNSNLLNVTGSTLRDNKNDRGGVLHAQNATVIARDVVFIETRGRTGMGAIEISSESSVLEALNCTFIGWAGDAMIVNGGRMTLDECGFEESSATTLVYSTSTATPAVVRNSRLGALNYDNELNNPGVLVRGAVECGDNSTTACAMGCVPGLAGVLCRYASALNEWYCFTTPTYTPCRGFQEMNRYHYTRQPKVHTCMYSLCPISLWDCVQRNVSRNLGRVGS